jgi:hypothetical protein
MAEQKLTSPRVRVIRDGADPMELQTDNRDLVLWDMTRPKHRWPKFDEAAFLWLTFISWAAARRTGVVNGATTFEAWKASVIEVSTVDTEEDDELGTPTQPGPEPG